MIRLVGDFFISYIQKYSASGFFAISDFIDARQDVYADSGAGVDLSNYSWPSRMAIFILGFLPYSIGFSQLASLFEGGVFVWLLTNVFVMWRHVPSGGFNVEKINPAIDKNVCCFFVLFFLLTCLVLSMVSGNLGLIARQRIMLYMPILIVYFVFRLVRAIHMKKVL